MIGAAPPRKAIEMRRALFDYDYFVDVRTGLNGRLPLGILLNKAKQIYQDYRGLKMKAGEEPNELNISRSWIDRWCKEYRISLKYPNKRFSISDEDRKRRIIVS